MRAGYHISPLSEKPWRPGALQHSSALPSPSSTGLFMTADVDCDDDVQVLCNGDADANGAEPKPAEKTECPICYEPCDVVGPHQLASLPCGHLFGDSCLQEWFKSKSVCPICKHKVNKKATRTVSLLNGDWSQYERAKKALEETRESNGALHQVLDRLLSLAG